MEFFALKMIAFQKIPILLYHRVIERSDVLFDLSSVSVEGFRKQMKRLSAMGYRTVSLTDLIIHKDSRMSFPSKPVIITFDDGYRDNYIHAFPILQSFNFKATVFLVIDFIELEGQSRKDLYLSWHEIKEMQQYGIEFQSHGMSHEPMDSLSVKKIKQELIKSKEKLEQHLRQPVRFYSYPFGRYNSEIKQLTKEAGFAGAVGGLPDLSGTLTDLYEIGRIEIFESDFQFMFMFEVLTGYNLHFFPLVVKNFLRKI